MQIFYAVLSFTGFIQLALSKYLHYCIQSFQGIRILLKLVYRSFNNTRSHPMVKAGRLKVVAIVIAIADFIREACLFFLKRNLFVKYWWTISFNFYINYAQKKLFKDCGHSHGKLYHSAYTKTFLDAAFLVYVHFDSPVVSSSCFLLYFKFFLKFFE